MDTTDASNEQKSVDDSHDLYKTNQNAKDDSDDEINLSEYALKALQEFYQEKELRDLHLDNTGNSINLVDEDWELSQFWYDRNTAEKLRDAALQIAGETSRIACIACPTVYTYLVNGNSKQVEDIYLFEYDKRFKDLYNDQCIFYDYNEPLTIPENFKSYFDLVLADPPYLSKECLGKTLETVKFIAKDKVILCTGATMENLAFELLNLKPCAFQPQHERKLGNEFRCYANFDLDEILKELKQNS